MTSSKPADSDVRLEAASEGVRIEVPPLGFARFRRELAQVVACLLLFLLLLGSGLWYLFQVGQGLWIRVLVGLMAILAVRWALLLSLLTRVARQRATIRATAKGLSIRRGVFYPGRERDWQASAITALDEDEGELLVLADGQAERFLAGRDPRELRWLAGLLREQVKAPADPPGLAEEIQVEYRLADWPIWRRGFVLIAPGRLRLRPRFSLETALVLNPVGAKGEETPVPMPGLMSGRMNVSKDDVSWGIGEGRSVMRIRLHEGEKEAGTLEIAAARPEELRRELEGLWILGG